ncbi:nucleopolyhedrovirus P10 family protein [Streptomyces sp. LRE541]|uniref:nucleopolyhedrovirus P10 family protein n=1 Tax=Streptomyces sp. LRE541 TaxID=2931983 RepID=UPI00201025E0|nr:nucleopolyhedrovirus P10 family protein [Streptomyces sp. LRE541]UPZ32045.1 nucleopolyhedrovirus P10 family protein [Streptomyces sp. LRE541]
MTADRWTQAVRQQLGLGRLLPLGGPGDGAWITEAAAASVLRRAAGRVPGVRLGSLRLALADPDGVYEPAVPPPPSALPPGPLRIDAEFAASPAEPLPAAASRLRAALTETATDTLGLTVTEVDLRVTGLLEEGEGPPQPAQSGPAPSAAPLPSPGTDESWVATAALAVPGVTALTGKAHITEVHSDTALSRRHIRVEIEVRETGRTLDTATAVRANITRSLPDHPTAAVLVTAVTPVTPAP